MTLYKWSQTASADATADSTINWAEGQSPSSVNDSARAMMAAIAKHRDDIAGAIVTSGTSTAYTVASYQQFDTLAHLSGQAIAFTPHVTNGATVTINIDGLGAKPLRAAPNVELPAGTVVQGTPYVALYNNADQAFYLQGFYGASPSLIPIGASIDYWGTAAPNSSFALMYGQAVSRTTYNALFALLGTTFGTGDGSTTFNIPDLRGRVVAGKDDMGGVAASRLTSSYFGVAATNLGAIGGNESTALVAAQLPTITSNGANNISVTGSDTVPKVGAFFGLNAGAGGGGQSGWSLNTVSIPPSGTITSSGSNSISVTSQGTGGAGAGAASPHRTVQPTIVANALMRII